MFDSSSSRWLACCGVRSCGGLHIILRAESTELLAFIARRSFLASLIAVVTAPFAFAKAREAEPQITPACMFVNCGALLYIEDQHWYCCSCRRRVYWTP